ncbi:MAG: hypothetical protein EDX89_00720 [Acidobacteria bacterium]|nr:MAG: hypothetical protein EDX89_00720 [Acidobacteriota bacterium]MCE7957337.1 hypothetical protein [Acidobacteria bacterium ACB2]
MRDNARRTGRTLGSGGGRLGALATLVFAAATLPSGVCLGQPEGILPDTNKTGNASAATTVTVSSFVVNTHPNRLLVANVALSDCRWEVVSGNLVFNGTEGFTQQLRANGPVCSTTTGGAPAAEAHWLLAPTETTANIVATVTCRSGCTCPPGSEPDVVIGVQGLYNVSQLDPGLTGGTGAGTSTVPLISTSTTPANVYVHGLASLGTSGAHTLDARLSQQWTDNTGTAVTDVRGSGGTVEGDPAGFILLIDSMAASTKWVVTLLEVKPDNPTAVFGVEFNALTRKGATLLRWRTGVEVSNLGFNVYREDDGVSSRVNPSLIAGSVFLVGPRTPLSQGRGYQWADPRPAGPTTRYWLEAVGLDGKTERFGPVVPAAAPATDVSDEEFVLATELSALGRSSEAAQAIPGIPAADSEPEAAPKPDGVEVAGSALATQAGIASGPAVKLSVSREGWYRVTRSQIAAAGLEPASTRYLQLYCDGVEQAIVVTEDEKGTDFVVEFHGRPIDTPYTATRVYWLVEGTAPGLRFARQARAGTAVKPPASFPYTVERKDRTIYFAALVNNGDASNFFGPVVSPTPLTQTLTLGKLSPSAGGDWPLEVALQGVTTDVNHSVEVRLNGNVAGLVNFDGQERGVATFRVPAAWLVEGPNAVRLAALGGSTDVSLVDSIRLTYPHRYEAESGVLKFVAPPRAEVSLAGAEEGTRIVDVTDPRAGVELEVSWDAASAVARAVVPGGWRLGKARTLIAFGPGRLVAPDEVKRNVPSSWSTDESKADLTVVTNAAFEAAANALSGFRQSQGLSARVVDVEDLYDELSFGAKDPASIRTYLAGSDSRYALLLGDATIDPRNFIGGGGGDLLPTKLVPATYLKTASDDWFVDFDQTGTASIPIGRIAVRTPADASAVVDKLISIDGSRSSAPWATKVVHVADVDDPDLAPYSFEEQVAALNGLVSPGFTKTDILVGDVGAAEARTQILARLNEGAALFVFVGHGTQSQWSKSNVFNMTDASTLTGAPRVPVLLPMDCLNGLFVDASADSLAERLQKQSGGPAAIWASSGLTEAMGQVQMAKSFYDQVFSTPGIRLGDAVRAAKTNVTDPDVRRTWILFGDPTMLVR